MRITAQSLTQNVVLFDFVTHAKLTVCGAVTFRKRWSLRSLVVLRRTGAVQYRDLARDYSRCTLISTSAASRTPIASMLMAIWPSIMLSRVQTTIVDPSSIGMAAVPFWH